MRSWIAALQKLVGDISLRPAIAIALVIGLSLPIAITVSRDLTERRETLLSNLMAEHARLTDILAIGMQTPIWDVRPDTGQPLIDAVMRDELRRIWDGKRGGKVVVALARPRRWLWVQGLKLFGGSSAAPRKG